MQDNGFDWLTYLFAGFVLFVIIEVYCYALFLIVGGA